MPIITDKGFSTDDWTGRVLAWDDTILTDRDHPAGYAIDLPNTADAAAVQPFFEACAMMRIAFPSFHDGRGFSLARHLRMLGYGGRLRAVGHVLADQYAMARRCGFDEVEISDDLAVRMGEEQWLFRGDWRSNSYADRLRGKAESDKNGGTNHNRKEMK